MLDHLRDSWWILVARGAVSIGAGVAALIWPAAAMLALVAVFGVYAFANGALSLGSAIRYRGSDGHGGLWALEGVLGIAAGLAAFTFPDAALFALVLTTAAWATVTGVLEIAAAIRLRREITGEWMLALAGVLSVAFGVALIAQPIVGAVTLLWLFVGYSLAFGALMIGLGLSARFWHQEGYSAPRSSRPSFPAHA